MADVQGDPRLVECPACFAPPGRPCNAPTDDGRRDVPWHHLSREGAALHPAPLTGGPWTPEEVLAGVHRREEEERQAALRRAARDRLPEHLQIETLQDFLEQKGER